MEGEHLKRVYRAFSIFEKMRKIGILIPLIKGLFLTFFKLYDQFSGTYLDTHWQNDSS